MRNKKWTNRRNYITQGWQFCSPEYRFGEGRGKRRKSYYNTGYSCLATHPSSNCGEQGLTLKVKSDHRSEFSNLSNRKEEA